VSVYEYTHDNRGGEDFPFGYVYISESTRVVYAVEAEDPSDYIKWFSDEQDAARTKGVLRVHYGSGGWVDPSEAERLKAAEYLESVFPEFTVKVEIGARE
jgi:hypothetical protein